MQRVVFYEITKNAVREAMEHPRELRRSRQCAAGRRALDYLVGFNFSPLLWKKVRRGLPRAGCKAPRCA